MRNGNGHVAEVLLTKCRCALLFTANGSLREHEHSDELVPNRKAEFTVAADAKLQSPFARSQVALCAGVRNARVMPTDSRSRLQQTSDALPEVALLEGRATIAPVMNAAFHPADDACPAPPFVGGVRIAQTSLQTEPDIDHPVHDGRDARLFPCVRIDLFTVEQRLVPVLRGEMIRESALAKVPSYWRVIPQIGRVWRERAAGEWSRAAFPLTLVNDTENHSHHGLVTFLYRGERISHVIYQFVQQGAPYLLGRHFVAWGSAPAEFVALEPAAIDDQRRCVLLELEQRLPARPWSELIESASAGTLEGFAGPLDRKWLVAAALVRDGVIYYQPAQTPYGPYPYPLEMRFAVRSVMKSIAAPLALLHLAEIHGPRILMLNVGDYVDGLHPKWQRIRFIDAVNMTTGFGGTGSFRTNPNDILDGYLEGDYPGWYSAPSHADKLAAINDNGRPYPWEPGTVMRYRDQDFYLLGAALDAFVKSVRGPSADLWTLLLDGVLRPIGVHHAPAVRTMENDEHAGITWFNAGYYPTLDDLAKISLLYQNVGAWGGRQLLHRQLTAELLAGYEAVRQDGDGSLSTGFEADEAQQRTAMFYKMGFHFIPYVAADGKVHRLPTMTGFGESEVTLYPNRLVSIVIGNAARFHPGDQTKSAAGPQTIRAVERLARF
jgi:CubicO group peptidase (beta-lactamase class C family)